MTDEDRPFKILGLQQVAIGSDNKASLEHIFCALLGLGKTGSFRSEKENVDEIICSVGEGSAEVEIDLMEPIDPEKKPRPDKPALNHIGFWVDDLETAYTWLARQGLRMAPGGIRKGAAGHNVFFSHPRGNDEFPIGSHVLLEFVQFPANKKT